MEREETILEALWRNWRTVLLMVLAVALPGMGLALAGWSAGLWMQTLREQAALLVVPYVVVGGLILGLALLPSHVWSLLGGYLFGGWAMVWMTLTLGMATALQWWITRKWAGAALRSMMEQTPTGQKLARRMMGATGWRAAVTVALARLAPQVPFALGSVVAASCRIRLAQVLAGTLLGMAPRVTLVVWIGTELAAWTPGALPSEGLLWALVGGGIGLGGLAWWSWRILRVESDSVSADQTCRDLSR